MAQPFQTLKFVDKWHEFLRYLSLTCVGVQIIFVSPFVSVASFFMTYLTINFETYRVSPNLIQLQF